MYLTDEDYIAVYSKVPRLCVDLVIRNEQGLLLLVKREQQPYVGLWHLPGGRVRKGETIEQAARRIAASEIGADVSVVRCLGYMEFRRDQGDLQECHSVSIVLSCAMQGCVKGTKATDVEWYVQVPEEGIHPVHQQWLKENRE